LNGLERLAINTRTIGVFPPSGHANLAKLFDHAFQNDHIKEFTLFDSGDWSGLLGDLTFKDLQVPYSVSDDIHQARTSLVGTMRRAKHLKSRNNEGEDIEKEVGIDGECKIRLCHLLCDGIET
jgi:hypothetical protein